MPEIPQAADYSDDEVTVEKVRRLIEQAHSFNGAICCLLESSA
jgi:hypothetical protein